jgi:hypothetical protein
MGVPVDEPGRHDETAGVEFGAPGSRYFADLDDASRGNRDVALIARLP